MGLNKPIRLLLTIFLSMASLPVFAQTKVSGHVYDSFGEPLIGASVVIKGTLTGFITDMNGAYTITAKSTDVLVAEYLR